MSGLAAKIEIFGKSKLEEVAAETGLPIPGPYADRSKPCCSVR